MSWYEYLLKCYAYNRIDKERWRRARMIAYNARIGSHLNPKDPKSVPRSEEAFLPLGDRQQVDRASKEVLEAMRRQREKMGLMI